MTEQPRTTEAATTAKATTTAVDRICWAFYDLAALMDNLVASLRARRRRGETGRRS